MNKDITSQNTYIKKALILFLRMGAFYISIDYCQMKKYHLVIQGGA